MATERDDDGLESFFAAARGAGRPSDDLVARVLADAAAVQGAGRAPAPAPLPRSGGWFSGLAGALGGWPAVSGVTLAGVAGLVLGFTAPDLVDSWSGGQIWSLSGGVGTMPEIGALWEEAGDV
ncbi:hypothetical protein [Roseicyclus persicicus]|uniref:Dihydroorotate dehydrogenase n=1 Tax=Roseicyclus persicicus TaxID=2650661 RepID=A0A7X6GY91_9RHOB|nr:hypothetical protein [Roseibacterium persicicum]NKX43703.1 hypothetical protein [Roseibacterium persicicum]